MVAWPMKFSGPHFPTDLILTAVGWYLGSNLSCRDLEELMAERGIVVDQSTINRWVVKDGL
jgi:transposase-like protein